MSDELFSVRDKVTLITGGSRGIGRGIAEGFLTRGANVVICSRDEATLKTAVAEMSTEANSVSYLVCDVAKPAEIKSCVAGVIEQHGRIDVLINVAGVNRRKMATEVTEDDYDFILDIKINTRIEYFRY